MNKPVELSGPRGFATRLRAVFDAEDVFLAVGLVLLAAGFALAVSIGVALVAVGALLLYLGLWHRTLTARALK